MWHCLLMRRGPGIRKSVDAHFYFPLLRTEKVLREIHSMWQVICDYLDWCCPDLENIIDHKYRNDWMD